MSQVRDSRTPKGGWRPEEPRIGRSGDSHLGTGPYTDRKSTHKKSTYNFTQGEKPA
jgi:hypothetical protein